METQEMNNIVEEVKPVDYAQEINNMLLLLPPSITKQYDNKLVKKKIEKLEKKAVKVTLDDIKTHTPELYKKIKKAIKFQNTSYEKLFKKQIYRRDKTISKDNFLKRIKRKLDLNFNKKSKYYQYFIDQIVNKDDEVVLKKFKVNLQNIEIESEED